MCDRRPLVGIVGAGIAGYRAADAVLKCGVDARVVIFGDEPHRTYNRPTLTKKGFSPAQPVGVPGARSLGADGAGAGRVDWRLGTRVESADLPGRTLRLSTGERFEYDRLVIASGVRPRTQVPSGSGCDVHTHRTLRGLDDAEQVHQDLRTAARVTIVGSGFVACEIASLAGDRGCEVVMLEQRHSGPFRTLLGERVSSALRAWLVRNGVEFRTGDAARESLCDRDRVTLPAARTPGPSSPQRSGPRSRSGRSVYVEAIGSVPNVEWLQGNELDLSDGVRVDEHMRVSGQEEVFAAGDVARYPDPWSAASFTRMEFWKNAIDTGSLAGRSVASSLGYDATRSSITYFPSMSTEVFGLRIQIGGNPRRADSAEILSGDLAVPDLGVLIGFRQQGVLVAVAYLDEGTRLNSDYVKLLTSLKRTASAVVTPARSALTEIA